MKISMVLIISLFHFPISAMGKSHSALRPHKISLSEHQSFSLSNGGPILDTFPTENQDLYILSSKSLWLYSLSNSSLKRLTTAPENSKFVSWSPSLERIALVTNTSFASLDLKTSKQKVVFPKQAKDGKTIDLIILNNSYLWAHERAIFQFEPKTSSISVLATKHDLKLNDKLLQSGTELFAIRRNILFKIQIKGRIMATTPLHKNYHDFIGLHQLNSNIYLQTRQALLVLDPDGPIKSAIPVSADKSLLNSTITKNNHVFIGNCGWISS